MLVCKSFVASEGSSGAAGTRFQCRRDAKRTDIFRSLDHMEADVSTNAVARNVGVGPGAHCASGDFMLEHTSLFAPAKTTVDLFGIRDGWTPSYRVAVQENAMRVRAPPVAPSSATRGVQNTALTAHHRIWYNMRVLWDADLIPRFDS